MYWIKSYIKWFKIINGDLFYNTKNINFNFLFKIYDILKNLSKLATVEIIKNEYCYKVFEAFINQIEEIKCDLTDISLFQLSKEDNNKIGFYAGNSLDDLKFIKNKFTPRFIEYKIDTIENIDSVEITKDFISLEINSDLLNKLEYKNKINIFLSKHEFDNIFYTEIKKDQNKIKLNDKNNNIRDILLNNIDKDIETELKEVFTIYDDKLNINK